MMMRWIKQLFCRHDYIITNAVLEYPTLKSRFGKTTKYFMCHKCGKTFKLVDRWLQ